MEITASILITLGALLGVPLTLVTLPGTWVALLIASSCVLWRGDSMHVGFLIAGVGLCVLGEVVEFFASAAGAARAGGSRRGAIGSVIGGLVGALVGTVALAFLPIVGTIIGATVGAGVGAVVGERTVAERKSWKESLDVGRGAAVGRLLSVVAKGVVAVVLAVVLIVGAWV